MSNLGMYQVMTSLAKRAGGPLRLGALIFGSGILVGSISTISGVAIKKKISALLSEKASSKASATIYVVTRDGCTDEGISFRVGDRFRLLERDNDAGLIERLGEVENPHVVSIEFLCSISNLSM